MGCTFKKRLAIALIFGCIITFIMIQGPQRPKQKYRPTAFHDAPDISSIEYQINQNVCEADSTIHALFLVVSNTSNFKERDSIRAAYSSGELKIFKVRRIFFLSDLGYNSTITEEQRARQKKMEVQLQVESKFYEDIVQSSLPEQNNFIIHRTLAALSWAVNNCNNTRLIVKMEDSILLDFYQTINLINTFSNGDVESLIGRQVQDSFTGEFYMDGIFYMASQMTAQRLLAASEIERLDELVEPDVYITGLLPKKAKINLRDIGRVISNTSDLHCCREVESNVMYLCDFIVGKAQGHTRADYMHMVQIKKHSSYCQYNQFCSNYYSWTRYLAKQFVRENVTCIGDSTL